MNHIWRHGPKSGILLLLNSLNFRRPTSGQMPKVPFSSSGGAFRNEMRRHPADCAHRPQLNKPLPFFHPTQNMAEKSPSDFQILLSDFRCWEFSTVSPNSSSEADSVVSSRESKPEQPPKAGLKWVVSRTIGRIHNPRAKVHMMM